MLLLQPLFMPFAPNSDGPLVLAGEYEIRDKIVSLAMISTAKFFK